MSRTTSGPKYHSDKSKTSENELPFDPTCDRSGLSAMNPKYSKESPQHCGDEKTRPRYSREARQPTGPKQSQELEIQNRNDDRRPTSSKTCQGDRLRQKSASPSSTAIPFRPKSSASRRPLSKSAVGTYESERDSRSAYNSPAGRSLLGNSNLERDGLAESFSRPGGSRNVRSAKTSAVCLVKSKRRCQSSYLRPCRDSSPSHHVPQSDLTKGNNYYLYSLAKIYDVTEMKRQKRIQYWNLLVRQQHLGFHSAKECESYVRYLGKPRNQDLSRTYSDQNRTKSAEPNRREDSKGRAVSAAVDGRENKNSTEDGPDNRKSSTFSDSAEYPRKKSGRQSSSADKEDKGKRGRDENNEEKKDSSSQSDHDRATGNDCTLTLFPFIKILHVSAPPSIKFSDFCPPVAKANNCFVCCH